MAHAGGGRALGVAHDVDRVRQVAVHLGHAVAVACMLPPPAQPTRCLLVPVSDAADILRLVSHFGRNGDNERHLHALMRRIVLLPPQSSKSSGCSTCQLRRRSWGPDRAGCHLP